MPISHRHRMPTRQAENPAGSVPSAVIISSARAAPIRIRPRIATDMREMRMEMDSHPHLFATEKDGDPYAWLGAFGCYSPIIHLQQTDRDHSSHQPFTSERNARGRILGDKVLEALRSSCEKPAARSMPRRCSDIYLTLEIFSKTSDISPGIIHNLERSVSYWRRFVPIDGLPLDQLAGNKVAAAVAPPNRLQTSGGRDEHGWGKIRRSGLGSGASHGRTILGVLQGGIINLGPLHGFANRPLERNGEIRWDFDSLCGELVNGLGACVAAGHRDLESICRRHWGIDFGLVDERDELLDLPRHYRDPYFITHRKRFSKSSRNSSCSSSPACRTLRSTASSNCMPWPKDVPIW